MRFRDIISYAWISLNSAKVRTSLMLIAMSIGVGAVVLLTGIGNGARLYITDQFSSLGTNLIIVIPGRSDTASNMPATLIGATPRDLTLGDAAALRRTAGISMVAPLILGELSAVEDGRSRQVPVLGTTAAFLNIHHLKLSRGKFISDEEESSTRPLCVIGAKVDKELFPKKNALGELMQLGGYRCRVSGILADQGQSLGFKAEEMVIVPVRYAQMLFNKEGLFRILLESREASDLEQVKIRIKATIAKRHYGEDDITIITQDSVLAAFDKMFRSLTLTVAGIAGISLLVAGILIMNVMLMSVSQRRAEIGLCKALGARNWHILMLFSTEALLLSVLGGATGIVLGLGIARIIHIFYPTLHTTPPLWAIAAALGTSLGTGLLFSYIPSIRAARLDPIQALASR